MSVELSTFINNNTDIVFFVRNTAMCKIVQRPGIYLK